MNQIKMLIQKYNNGRLRNEDEQLLEQYIEEGLIALEELEDIREIDRQLDQLFGARLSYQMRQEFQNRMQQETSRYERPGIRERIVRIWNWTPNLRPAPALLSFLIILAGSLWLWNVNTVSRQELAVLTSELQKVQESLLLSLLEKESTGERLKAVSLTREMGDVSEQVAGALLKTLQEDENVNVRLAAIDALVAYAHHPAVREGLIESIRYQDSPLVQIALAEVMVSLQEKRSVKPLQELLEQGKTPAEVQDRIQNSIEVLL